MKEKYMVKVNEYNPFGDTLSTSAGETARIGFIGQEQDIEHGYFNMGARYYDPEIGRFLSVDPLFEMYTEYTPYNYCNNSPMMFRDPSGMSMEIALVEGQLTLIYVTDQVDVTAERTPDESDWYNIPRLGGGGGSLAKGVNKMGYSSLISGIMNNNAPLHSFFYFNFAESGEMNGNARGIGNTGSANGNSNSSNGGGSGSAGIPKEARLDYEAEETEYIPNLSNYYNGSNALSFFPADNTSTCTNCLFGISSAKDFQIFFDLAGIIHPAGDILSAGISFENGDYVDGLLSLAAIIPIAGDLAKYGGKILKLRPDVIIKGGRSGQLIKKATGPANSVIKGSNGRILITDDSGKIIWDITTIRAKPVIPNRGFGPKREPTEVELELINKIWGK
jgi:RHS repeat-associated protein